MTDVEVGARERGDSARPNVKTPAGIGVAYLRHQRGRAILTGLGVVMGVALFLGNQVAAATLGRAFQRQYGQANGQLQLFAIPAGTQGALLSPPTVAQVSRESGVAAAVPELSVPASRDDGSAVQLDGVAPDGPRWISFPLVAGRIPRTGAAEVMLTEGRAERLGSALAVETPTGPHRLVVVGLLANQGPGAIHQGSIVYTSLATAQALANHPGASDGVGLMLAPGTDVPAWISAHQDDMAGVRLVRTQSSSGLGIVGTGLTFFSVLALLIGAFLIYLTLSEAVVERTSTYGLLRALGATRRQVRGVIAREAVALGAVATVVGIGVGVLVGLGLVQVMASVYGISRPGFVLSPLAVLVAVVLGVGAAWLGARRPAGRAARISPVVAMRGDVTQRTRTSRAWVAGGVLLVGGSVEIALGHSTGPVLVATLALLAGAVLMVPLLLGPLATALGWVSSRWSGGVGRIATLHLRDDRHRSAYTLALLMAVLAVTLGAAVAMGAAFGTIDTDLTHQMASDIRVTSPENIPPSTQTLIDHTPGVAETSPVGYGSATYVDHTGDHDLVLFTIDPVSYFGVDGFNWVHGSTAVARSALEHGDAVLLPNGLAGQLGAKVGSWLRLRTADGLRPFRVAGIYAGFQGYAVGTVMDMSDARRWFGGGTYDELAVRVTPGSDRNAVAASLRQELHAGDKYSFGQSRFEVVTATQLASSIDSQDNTLAAMFKAIEVAGLAVGLLGLANMLILTVLLRAREIGLLRAVGTQRRQLAGMVLTEAATLVGIAFLMAVPVGAAVGAAFLHLVWLFADTARFHLAPSVLGELLVIAVITALLAGWFPARRTSRLDPTVALRFD